MRCQPTDAEIVREVLLQITTRIYGPDALPVKVTIETIHGQNLTIDLGRCPLRPPVVCDEPPEVVVEAQDAFAEADTPLPPRLSQFEADILRAVGAGPTTAATIAASIGLPTPTTSFRGTLASLCERGILVSGTKGYKPS